WDVPVGEIIDDINLSSRAGLRGTEILNGATDLLGCHLCPCKRGIIVGVGGRLNYHPQGKFTILSQRIRNERTGKRYCSEHETNRGSFIHSPFLPFVLIVSI